MPKKKKSYADLVAEDSYCRNFNIEIWDKWDEDVKDPEYTYNSCSGVLKFIEEHYKYYIYCHHDKDIWTESDYSEKKDYMDSHDIHVGDHKQNHYQIFVKFTNPRYKSTIAKELNIPDSCIIKALSAKGSIMYIIHENEVDKWHYDISEARGTLIPELIKYIGLRIPEEDKSNEILDLIVLDRYWSMYKLTREINKRGLYSHFIRGYSLYRDILQEHREGQLIDEIMKEKNYPWS